jgi:hypothetical protein
MKPDDFKSHGQWMHENRIISRMWKHVPSGKMYYEDTPEVRELDLLIYPFSGEQDA